MNVARVPPRCLSENDWVMRNPEESLLLVYPYNA